MQRPRSDHSSLLLMHNCSKQAQRSRFKVQRISINKHLLRFVENSILSHTEFSNVYQKPFVYSDTSQIPRTNRITAWYSLQNLITERKMVSANTSFHKLSSKLKQRLIVEYIFLHTTEAKPSTLPTKSELSEQALLSLSRERDKHIIN